MWCLAVEFLDAAGPTASGGGGGDNGQRKNRIDYKETLPPAEFARFSKLRELRKQIAEAEGLLVYAVFTNEQLAAIAQKVPGAQRFDSGLLVNLHFHVVWADGVCAHELGRCWVSRTRLGNPCRPVDHSASKPWVVNFRVRLFSVTVRTICSEAPFGSRASISSVIVNSAPT